MKSFKCHKISDGRSEGPAIIKNALKVLVPALSALM